MFEDQDKMVLGTELTPKDQRHVLASYVHRYTGDRIPVWAKGLRADGKPKHPLQFADDQDWLANTWFHVRTDGRLDGRFRRCHSVPTWPQQTRECAYCREERSEHDVCQHQSNWARAVCKFCCGNLGCYEEFDRRSKGVPV